MQKLSVTLSGHRTSISLEKPFLDTLRKIATIEHSTVSKIIGRIDTMRDEQSTNLSAAIRVWVLQYLLQVSKL